MSYIKYCLQKDNRFSDENVSNIKMFKKYNFLNQNSHYIEETVFMLKQPRIKKSLKFAGSSHFNDIKRCCF